MVDALVAFGIAKLGVGLILVILGIAIGVAWHHFITVLKDLKKSVDRVGESLDNLTKLVENTREEVVSVERRVSILEAQWDHA